MTAWRAKTSDGKVLLKELDARVWSRYLDDEDDDEEENESSEVEAALRGQFGRALFPASLLKGKISSTSLYCRYLATLFFIYGYFGGWTRSRKQQRTLSNSQNQFIRLTMSVFKDGQIKRALETDLKAIYGPQWEDDKDLHGLVLTDIVDAYFNRLNAVDFELICAHVYVRLLGDMIIAAKYKKSVVSCASSTAFYDLSLQGVCLNFQQSLDRLCFDKPKLCDTLIFEANAAFSMNLHFFKELDKAGGLKPELPLLPQERVDYMKKVLSNGEVKQDGAPVGGPVSIIRKRTIRRKKQPTQEEGPEMVKEVNKPPKIMFDGVKGHVGIDYDDADIAFCPALNPDGTPKQVSKSTQVLMWGMFTVIGVLALGIYGYYGLQEIIKFVYKYLYHR